MPDVNYAGLGRTSLAVLYGIWVIIGVLTLFSMPAAFVVWLLLGALGTLVLYGMGVRVIKRLRGDA